MPIEVKMAKLSPTMESGQMVRWLVKVGDKVKEGDTLAEIQTDKAVMPMEAFDDGVVALLDVKEGDDIALGQRVCLLAGKGEDPRQVAESQGKPSTPAVGKTSPSNGREPARRSRRPPRTRRATATASTSPRSPRRPVGSSRALWLARWRPRPRSTSVRSPVQARGGRVIRRDVESYLADRPTAAVKIPARHQLRPGRRRPARP